MPLLLRHPPTLQLGYARLPLPVQHVNILYRKWQQMPEIEHTPHLYEVSTTNSNCHDQS